MNGIRRAILANLLGALLLLSMTSAIAQDNPAVVNRDEANPAEANRPEAEANRPEQDPPGRVARLQFQSGSISIQPQGTGDWVEGSMNRPLTNSDNIWADKDSKAELNVGTGLLRISNETSLTLTNIGDNNVQVQLHQGTLNLHVRRLNEGETYEVDTPNLAFAVQKPGDYRFDVGAGGDGTVINVWKGEGEATGDGPTVPVHAHERAEFNGTSLDHQISEVSAPDSFDEWCQQRDQRQDHSASARYVSPEVIGSEDLDQNGTWSETPPYGPVWTPAVAPGWAPYRYGHWAWIDPWGWTWVDDASWGFAPFHYGRWIYTGGNWGWAPGPYYVQPFYAPALVAWFGGPGWGASFGFGGGFGWCPLGFGEPFFPWYRGSRFYFRNVNIRNTRITNINHISNNFFNNGHRPLSGTQFHYANLHAPGGITAASQRAITGAMPIARNSVRVSAQDAERAQIRGNLSMTPTRTSRLGANAGRPAATPPTRAISRPVVSSASSRTGRTQMASLNNRVDRPGAGAMTGKPSPSTPLRSVPRPPQAQRSEGFSRNSAGASRPEPTQSASTRSVPRPPSGARISPQERSISSAGRSEARPSEGGRPSSSRPNTVPRPTGRVQPASRDTGREYASRSASPSSASRSGGYNGAPRSYGGSPRYSAPPADRGYGQSPRYSAPPSGRSYGSAPSYHSSAPAYHGAAPSYQGSAPAYHGSAPAYHASAGSYHGSAPSGGHSGGGGPSGGGGHSSGGHSGHGR